VTKLLPLLLSLLLLVGCPKPFVELSPDYSPQPLEPGILACAAAGFVSDANAQTDEGKGAMVMNAVMNAHLPEFGERMMPRMETFLAERGFELQYAHDRVSVAEQAKLEKLGNVTALLGAWGDPRGSMLCVDNSSLGRKHTYDLILERAAPVADDEHFVFISAPTYSKHRWLVVGYPQMVLDIIVIDGQGNELYRARGVGDGPSSAFVVLHHVEALEEALENALASIEAVEAAPAE
jgi:hypothetical protein